jgi:hypothetical protein
VDFLFFFVKNKNDCKLFFALMCSSRMDCWWFYGSMVFKMAFVLIWVSQQPKNSSILIQKRFHWKQSYFHACIP